MTRRTSPCRSSLAFGAALMLALASAAGASFLPLDHPAYRDIDALEVRGFSVVGAPTLKPYTRAQIAEGLERLRRERPAMSRYERGLMDRLWREFAPDYGDAPGREAPPRRADEPKAADWRLAADINPRIVAQANPLRLDQPRAHRLPATRGIPRDRIRSINTLDLSFRVAPGFTTGQRVETDTDGLLDNDYRGGVQTYTFGTTGQVDAAYVLYETKWGAVAFGRIPLRWGPGRVGNLFLSDNAPAPDMLLASANVRWLHFTAFTGQLESTATRLETETRRYLAGHRLVLTPFPWVEIGAAEAMVYGGPDQSLSLPWSNPVNFFYGEEVNSAGAQNNGLAAADLTVRPTRGAEAYGALLVDDWSFDNRSPDRYALTLGLRWERPFGWDRAGFGAEYTRLTRWVYNNANLTPYLRYTHRNGVLGHYLGPDGDALFLSGSWESARSVNGRGVLVTVLLTHRRQGATRFDSPFPVDFPGTNFGYSSERFPSGIVETGTTGEVLISSPPVYGLTVTANVLAESVRNRRNEEKPRAWDVGFRLDLDWHIPVRR